MAIESERFTETPLDTVTPDGTSNRTPDCESDAGKFQCVGPCVDQQRARFAADLRFMHVLEGGFAAEAQLPLEAKRRCVVGGAHLISPAQGHADIRA